MSRDKTGPGILPALSQILSRFCRNPADQSLQRLHVRSLPALWALHNIELNGLAFLEALESARVDCRVMHEDVFAVLARNKTKALRVIEPLHGTLFHFFSNFLN